MSCFLGLFLCLDVRNSRRTILFILILLKCIWNSAAELEIQSVNKETYIGTMMDIILRINIDFALE